MFYHNFKYSFKNLFRNKSLVFWTFAFPILLGLFFNMAFSDIENKEAFNIIDIAIINNEEFQNNNGLKTSFEQLSSGDNKVFEIKYVTEEEAKQLMEEEKIIGYINFKETNKIVVKSNGINQTIFKYVTDQVIQTDKILNNKIIEEVNKGNTNIEKIYKDTLEMINNEANIKDESKTNLSYMTIEFYTLIAMACLYSGMLGMNSINQNLPNMSNSGKRLSVTPISKDKMIFSSVLASFLIQLIGIALLLLFTILVLKADFGNNIPLIILLSLAGSLAGLSMGILVGVIFKTNAGTKDGIIISITMLGCFLAGMMGVTMKYVIDKNIPIINKLNPANMITDGFYSLYYYDTLDRFYFNLFSLLIISFIMLLISFISLRRQKYDSI